VKLDSFGKATVIVDVKADATTEGAETLNLVLSNGAKVTADVAVNDVSLTPAAVAKTFTLTTGVDAVADFTGTAADDTFNARATNATTGVAATTVNDGDTLDGGAGKDTLNITATADNNRSLTGLATSNIETINIAGANNLGTLTTAAAAATAGAAQVQVLDITGARFTGEVQSVDFAGMTIATAGNVTIAGTTVALAAGDNATAIAGKVAAKLALLTTEIASVTQAGSKLTVTYLAANATTGVDLADPDGARLTVATDANTSPVTLAAGSTSLATVNNTLTTVTTFSASNSVTVKVNGTDYVVDVADVAGLNVPAVAAPAAPTVVTTQGVTAVTPITAVAESSTITFDALIAGETVTVAGRTLTAGTGGLTDVQVAQAFSSNTAAPAGATFTGTLTGFTSGAAAGAAVVFTQTGVSGNVTNISVSNTAAPVVASITTTGASGVSEVTSVTFGALTVGQSVTFAGRTVAAKAGGAGLTALEVAAAFATTQANVDAGNLTVSGTLVGATTATGAVLTHTAASPGVVATPLAVTVGALTAPTVVTVDGTAGRDAVAAVQESSVVTFGSLLKGQSVTVAGATVTAAADMAAADVTTAMLALAPTNFVDTAVTGSTTTLKYTSTTATGNVADIVTSSAGSGSTSARETAVTNTVNAVTAQLNKVLAGAVTVGAGDEAGEIKLTSNSVGTALPTVTVSQGTTSRSSVDTADGATVASAGRTQTAAATQVVSYTVNDGTGSDNTFTAASFELFVNGVSAGVTALASTEAAAAIALAAAINAALGSPTVPVAVAVGAVVTVTAPVAGTALPILSVALTKSSSDFAGEAIAFTEVRANTQAVAQVVSAGSASVNAAQFVGSELVDLSGASGAATVTGVTAGQTIGFTGVAMANTVAFGALTSGSIAVNASAGTLTTTGKALTTLALSGTGTSGLTITDGDTVTATGLAPITTLNLSTSGSTVLNTASMGSLAALTQTGAGGVTLTPGTKLASITTGAGADTLRVSTATAIDNLGTTTNEAVNAVVNSAAGNDRLIIATTGAGTTTVDAGAGDDTLFVSTLSTGQNSLSGGDGNDAFRISSGSGLIAGLQNTTISGGAGTDTLRVSNTTFAASDYTILTANVSSVETLELSGVVTALDASKVSATGLRFLASGSAVTEVGSGQAVTLARTATATATPNFAETGATAANPNAITVSSKGFILDNDATVAGRQSVFGDNLGVTLTNTADATSVVANGNVLTLGVAALGTSSTVTGNSTVATVTGELTGINVALQSARGSGTVADVENVAGFIASVVANNLDDVTSIVVTGSGTATITAGTIAAVDAKLTTINVSGMTAFADQNLLGDLQGGVFTNRSTSTITLNNNVAETVLLGGAKDTVATGSTIVARDVVTGFQVVADAASTLGAVDLTRSDVLKIGTAFDSSAVVGTANHAAKMTVTGSTLEAALLQAAGLKGGALGTTDIDKVVFNFGGNTYVYVDTGANGLTDNDQLVQLSGTLNLDLLLQSGVIIA
jgi:hypothetical protein